VLKGDKTEISTSPNGSAKSISGSSVKPFLRWAGGKTWFLKIIENFLPEQINNYYEPFLGGGSIFFFLMQTGKIKGKSHLSDSNKELIDCYIQIRDNVEGVIEYLQGYHNNEDFYYYMRSLVPKSDLEKAAQFIYLNRTSFNGLYRVNLNGVYNVPYGFKSYKTLFDFDNLRKASSLLKDSEIITKDFQNSLTGTNSEDFIFLDPPYTVAHDNNGFVKYNQRIFAWSDQERLAVSIESIVEKGANYVLTNAAHSSIEDLFGRYGVRKEVSRYSVIGGKKAIRGLKNEYVFYSYDRRHELK
jgi:DNA adenine methylase